MLLDSFTNTKKEVVIGENINFSLKCDKCGSDAHIMPRRYFQYNHNVFPNKVTLEFKCDCGNQFTAVIV